MRFLLFDLFKNSTSELPMPVDQQVVVLCSDLVTDRIICYRVPRLNTNIISLEVTRLDGFYVLSTI